MMANITDLDAAVVSDLFEFTPRPRTDGLDSPKQAGPTTSPTHPETPAYQQEYRNTRISLSTGWPPPPTRPTPARPLDHLPRRGLDRLPHRPGHHRGRR